MASKRTVSVKKKAPVKKAPVKKAAAPKEKKAPVKVGPRHPAARIKATSAGSKEALAKAIAPILVMGDEDADSIASRLKTASNSQLLRLQKVSETVKSKYGSRAGLIEAIGKSGKKSKDKDYIAKLETLSLPNLLSIAQSLPSS